MAIAYNVNPKFKELSALRQRAEAFLDKEKNFDIEEHSDIYALIYELNVQQIELEIQNEELRQTQAELENSRNLYVDLYNFAPVSYFTLARDKSILAINLAGTALLGLEQNQLYRKSLSDFILPTSRKTFHHHIKQVLNTRIKQVCEAEILKEDGGQLHVQIESILNREGYIQTSIIDITSHKQAELKLRELNESLCLINNLFQSVSDPLAVLDREFRFVIFNNAFKQTFAEIFGAQLKADTNLLNILADSPKLQTKVITACRQAFTGKEISLLKECNIDKNMNYRCYEMRFSPGHDGHAQSTKIMFRIRDITTHKLRERKQFKQQAELAHVARMNAMGEMATALAHEINQPLATINAYSQGCLIKLQQGITEASQLIFTLQQVAAQAEHAGEITHRMKNFMREGKTYPEKVDINKLIKNALIFLNYELDSIKLNTRLELAEGLPELYIDRVQITQVILNLARNSIEAMQNKPVAHPEITIRTCLKETNIEVHVIDNGPGIPAKIADVILNSYFTTKPQGTGLGLAICRTLLEAHGGKLLVHANQKRGAWFQFTLPINSTQLYADT